VTSQIQNDIFSSFSKYQGIWSVECVCPAIVSDILFP
jgi:hypothetical protein